MSDEQTCAGNGATDAIECIWCHKPIQAGEECSHACVETTY